MCVFRAFFLLDRFFGSKLLWGHLTHSWLKAMMKTEECVCSTDADNRDADNRQHFRIQIFGRKMEHESSFLFLVLSYSTTRM